MGTDTSKFSLKDFGNDLKSNLDMIEQGKYDKFDDVLKNTFQYHAPQKSITVRANQKPFVTKELRKAIMRRSQLQKKVFKFGKETDKAELKKHQNYVKRLSK